MNLQYKPAFLTLATVAAITLHLPARAAEEGDEKCGPDKYILKFDGKKWRETSRKCSTPDGESASRGARGGAEDGDEKCGPDNYILKFDARAGESGRWRETSRKCK